MNETIRTLLDRQSIRAYRPEQIPEELLQELLSTCFQAATAVNAQPWHFIVIQNRAVIEALGEISGRLSAAETLAPGQRSRFGARPNWTFFDAPTVVFFCGDGSRYAATDCANAAQNLCVAATSAGLGSCYMAYFRNIEAHAAEWAEYLRLLRVPEGYSPYYCVPIGYPAGERPPKRVRDTGKISYIR